jgi:secreted PhoX family phosphatase
MTKKEFDIGHDECNTSNNESFENVLADRLSRRDVMKMSVGLIGTAFFGTFMAGCNDDDSTTTSAPAAAALLGFSAVAKNLSDVVTVPSGYTAKVLYSLGDPISSSTPNFANDGTDSADSFEHRAGDHHDGMSYFGLNSGGTAKDTLNSSRGLLAMNHENITQMFLHTSSEVAALSTTNRPASQIDKEVNVHGVSIIEIQNSGSGFAVNKSSDFNRRITAATPMDISGPAKNSTMMVTKYSTNGSKTRGTLNNCANGYTPWGTYLTCEENWAGYFKRTSTGFSTKETTAQSRYGTTSSNGNYGWANSVTVDDKYDRWHIAITGADATSDYRNVANSFGWNVEIDPYNPSSTPRKRTAMGRFGHEGAMPGIVTAGKPIVYYMGDDSKGEYIYKYVSTQNWDATDANGGLVAGNKYLDDGKLYVAKFNADGSGAWMEVALANIPASYTTYSFSDAADVAINTRLASDALGATKMDRPEWTGVHPTTGDVYITLTNNSDRAKSGKYGLDAANPRYYTDTYGSSTTNKGNVNGHIIRMKETGANAAATTFNWDIYLFGAQSDANGTNVNISGLTDDNDFSSPDGLFFSQATKGLMWLQTDDGAYRDVTNCMMLAAVPGAHGDGTANYKVMNTAVPTNSNVDQEITTFVGKDATASTLKRFLVGPKGCEITGITETPDGKTIFVNIQHPGENTADADIATPANYESHWPATDGTARPRSATIVITKNDGGVVGY